MSRQRPSNSASLEDTRSSDPDSDWRVLTLVAYAVTSGAIAIFVGAAISFAAHGTQRLELWAAATGATATAAGIAHDSRLMASCRLGFSRLIHRLAKLSASGSTALPW